MRSRVLGLIVVLGVAVGVFGSISPAGAASKPGAPGRPTAVVAGNKSARVSWPAPTNGGSPITIYLVTPYVGTKAQKTRTFHSKATSELVTGLSNGKSYTFRVAAHNAVGTGKQSAASTPVTLGMPGAPSHLTAAPGNAQATVTWSAPANGSAIVSYTVTPYLGSKAQAAETFHSTATTEVVTGLTNLKSYSFRVTARNAAGAGLMSDAVGTVEPTSAPTLSMMHSAALNEDILVNAYGNAVYMYAPDGTGAISKAGAELYIWPSVDWSGTPTLGAGLTGAAVVEVQHDGARQLSYNGHLLYTFAYDPPGGATGDGEASFYLLSPAGAEI